MEEERVCPNCGYSNMKHDKVCHQCGKELPKTYKITSCARCGNDHEGIKYRKLTNPVVLGDIVLTHWTMCPDLDEPILMYFVEETSVDR